MPNDDTTTPPVIDQGEPTRWGLRSRELRMIAIIISIKALLFLFAGQSYQILQNQRVVGLRSWLEIFRNEEKWPRINAN